ncbi:hypothetical protein [Methylobacterium tarhaniae]|uniref:hypothetical protein n=1 Tax=Methylobacterium tarhaniae TaxID=1187852 RepID=UPI000A732E56|nr:hypothetical protein [Methylobacterium tarhaniae]
MPEALVDLAPGPSRADVARVARQLRRLEALAARHRFRRRVIRLVRGGAGGGAAFLVLVKAKLVGSLAGKLAIAALVGLGFAWPLAALALVMLLTVVAALLECEPFGVDACDCFGPNARRARLRALIAQRRAWLAVPAGEAPRIRNGSAPARR